MPQDDEMMSLVNRMNTRHDIQDLKETNQKLNEENKKLNEENKQSNKQLQELKEYVYEENKQLKEHIYELNKNFKEYTDEVNKKIDEISKKKYIEDEIKDNPFYRISTFFDTSKGLYCWFPVQFTDTNNDNHDLTVLSIPMMLFFIKNNGGINVKDIDEKIRNLDRFIIERNKHEEFIKIITNTPFRAYTMYDVKGDKKKTLSIEKNKDNYIIMESEYWKKIIGFKKNDIHFHSSIPKMEVLNRNSMSQQYALESVSVDNTNTPLIKEFGNIQFDYDKRSTWPAMGIPLWREAYGSVQNFFGMDSLHHIKDGKISIEELSSFEETLLRVEKNIGKKRAR